MKTKTATIARDKTGPGTWKVGMYYRDNYVTWKEAMVYQVPVILCPDPQHQAPLTPETLARWKAGAKSLGFTHIKIAGDWTGVDKPKGGKL